MLKCKANLQGRFQKPWKAKSALNVTYICLIEADETCNGSVGLSINVYLPNMI